MSRRSLSDCSNRRGEERPGLSVSVSCVAQLSPAQLRGEERGVWWPLVAASCGSRLGLLAPSGPELRALGSNFSTGTGTEEVAQDQHSLPRPVGEHQHQPLVRSELTLRDRKHDRWDTEISPLTTRTLSPIIIIAKSLHTRPVKTAIRLS